MLKFSFSKMIIGLTGADQLHPMRFVTIYVIGGIVSCDEMLRVELMLVTSPRTPE